MQSSLNYTGVFRRLLTKIQILNTLANIFKFIVTSRCGRCHVEYLKVSNQFKAPHSMFKPVYIGEKPKTDNFWLLFSHSLLYIRPCLVGGRVTLAEGLP